MNMCELIVKKKRGSRLNEKEKAALLAEGAEATDWIYTVIKEICKGEREND